MNLHSRISLVAFILTGWIAAHAFGQFPWSKDKDAAAAPTRTGSITWKTDLEESLKQARDQRKLVFLHFSGTHCPPCRKLEDNVLNRNDVAVTMLSRYVPVFIVVEQAPELVERFQVQAWPTDVIIDADGRELARHVSPQDPREFIKKISMVAAKHHAGQSATIANVRAAVAADISEPNSSVQQTAADDRALPKQSPRAESKVLANPHTRDSRLPPIVARNTKSKSAPQQDEDGFSPPNKRRKPPIVRKPREAEEEEMVANISRPSVDEETGESEVAPWRKSTTKETSTKQPEEQAESEKREHVAKSKIPSEPKAILSEKSTLDEPAPDEVIAKVDEPVENEANTHVAEKEAEAKEEVDEPQVLDEAPALKSRFGVKKPAQELAKEPTAENPPAKETKEEKVEEVVKEEVEKTPVEEAPAESPKSQASKEEPASESSKAETAEPDPSAETTEVVRPKSRFAGSDDAPVESKEEEPEPSPEQESTPEPEKVEEGKPVAEDALEVEAKKAVEKPSQEAAKVDASSEQERVTSSKSEEETSKEPQAKETSNAQREIENPETETEQPVEAPTKKPTKKAIEALLEEKREVAAEEQAGSLSPRGLAKIARSGKYVLNGYCCVTLLESEELKKGNPKIGAIHRGRIFLFSSAEARKKFLQNPDDYGPVLTGYDPVIFADKGELVEGSAKILAKLHDGRVVTFASEESYKKFAVEYQKLRDKSPYIQAMRTAMQETNGGRHFR